MKKLKGNMQCMQFLRNVCVYYKGKPYSTFIFGYVHDSYRKNSDTRLVCVLGAQNIISRKIYPA